VATARSLGRKPKGLEAHDSRNREAATANRCSIDCCRRFVAMARVLADSWKEAFLAFATGVNAFGTAVRPRRSPDPGEAPIHPRESCGVE
jgi:hypothetical protein